MTMLERVAKAMEMKRQELIAKPLARIYPDLARAAIEALMEPDNKLLKKLKLTPEYKETYIEYKFYQAMLKVVLEEGK